MSQSLLLIILFSLFMIAFSESIEENFKEQALSDLSKIKNAVNDKPVIGIYTVPSTYPEKYPTS